MEAISDKRELWKIYWKSSQTQFCKQYGLNQGNFSSWMRGKDSPGVEAKVTKFLLELDLPKSVTTIIHHSKLKITQIVTTMKQRCFDSIIFIDIDNCTNLLPKVLEEIEPYNCCCICFGSKDYYSTIIRNVQLEGNDKFFICRP